MVWQVILTLVAQALAAGTGCEAFDRGSLGRRAGKATAAALQLAILTSTYRCSLFILTSPHSAPQSLQKHWRVASTERPCHGLTSQHTSAKYDTKGWALLAAVLKIHEVL